MGIPIYMPFLTVVDSLDMYMTPWSSGGGGGGGYYRQSIDQRTINTTEIELKWLGSFLWKIVRQNEKKNLQGQSCRDCVCGGIVLFPFRSVK